jgi:ketosteroid isomerase-like protein
MTPLRPDALARRYIDTLGAGQIEECLALFHEDAVVKFPASVVGGRRLTKGEFGAMLTNMPNLFDVRPTYTLLDQVSEGDRSCIEFVGVGRMKSGADFNNEYCIVFVVARGLIMEMREYLDTGALQAAAKSRTS